MATSNYTAISTTLTDVTRREHSRKPDEAYHLIEGMYPELPKLELFARSCRAGWDAWGNEVERFPTAPIVAAEDAQ